MKLTLCPTMRPTLAHEGLTITSARGPGATYRIEKAGRHDDR
jgi:hypothetical protein